MAYTGTSIVDYLKSTGKDSSFASRKLLAEQMGIPNYTGTGSQNTQFLNSLRNLLTKPEPAPKVAPAVGNRPLTPTTPIQQVSAQAPTSSRDLTPTGTSGGMVQPQAPQPIQSPQSTIQQTIAAMLRAAQGAGNEDLMAKRNAIIQARFNAQRQATPEELRILSPQQQASLRGLDVSGLEEQLGGVSAAIKGREAQTQAQQEAARSLLSFLQPKEVGGNLINPYTGEIVYESPKEAKHSPAYLEFQDAVAGGYKGSFNDYQNLDANRKQKIAAAGRSVTTTGGGVGTSGKFTSDLDAIIGNTLATIQTKFGQQQFQTQINRARNDADKISTIASVVLKSQPAEIKRDYANQTSAIKNIDKAIALIDDKVKTGAIQSATQYTYNVFGKDFDPNLTKINQYITSAIQPYRNSITGAAWGDQEDNEYAQLFGSTKYSPKELKQRLIGIKEIMKDKSVSSLNSFVNPIDTYANPFITSQTSQPQTMKVGKDIYVLQANGKYIKQ